jgi:hypothetical protein
MAASGCDEAVTFIFALFKIPIQGVESNIDFGTVGMSKVLDQRSNDFHVRFRSGNGNRCGIRSYRGGFRGRLMGSDTRSGYYRSIRATNSMRLPLPLAMSSAIGLRFRALTALEDMVI